ncbi:MAG: BNR-4 repeat-containing protein [Planctomycetota bacterium]
MRGTSVLRAANVLAAAFAWAGGAMAEAGASWKKHAANPMPDPSAQPVFCTPGEGYRGIWHGQTPTRDRYRYKYSGGLGTYCAKHRPMAVHCPEVGKTFFVYGGTSADRHTRDLSTPPGKGQPRGSHHGPDQLYHCVGTFDHATGEVLRPVVIFDKYCGDPHDNPVISVDPAGHIWVFSPSHGASTTDSFIHRSTSPHDPSRFETVSRELFAYPQPWWIEGEGFAFFHTRYEKGRGLWFRRSADGHTWEDPVSVAHLEKGHYQVSASAGRSVATAFNLHPRKGGLEARTNLYVVMSDDAGRTWQAAGGEPVALPVRDERSPALAWECRAEGKLVYLKDLVFDSAGRPCVLVVTSRDNMPGEAGNPRELALVRWDGRAWRRSVIARVDHNYDAGQIARMRDGRWLLVAPTEPGPQPGTTGGDMVLWESPDEGESWRRVRRLTQARELNHTYARVPLNAHPDFVAFWSDGDTLAPSACRLYFCNDRGEVYRLPWEMRADRERPERVLP